jgi:hypothetical protein
MKNKYVVKNAAGEVIGKRSSERIYTHAIVAGPDKKEYWVARMESEAATYSKHIAKYDAAISYLENGGKLTHVPDSWAGAWYMTDLKKVKGESGSLKELKYGTLAGDGADEADARAKAIQSYQDYKASATRRVEKAIDAAIAYAVGPDFIGREGVLSFHQSYANAVKALGSVDYSMCSFEIVEVEVAA